VTRLWLTALILAAQPALAADQPDKAKSAEPQVVYEEPPEEDAQAAPKEYAFNPLQAGKEITVGKFYFRKGSYKAALRRFEEAVKWDPGSAEAWLRLGDTHAKLNDKKAARQAYSKYLDIEPDGKEAESVRRKINGKS
jgi:tetratricopeptide (TPR) repeat protein